nr:MAG TPA: hypothetical protein [Caudoviricetes sp.]
MHIYIIVAAKHGKWPGKCLQSHARRFTAWVV